jgi:hypothetical protein
MRLLLLLMALLPGALAQAKNKPTLRLYKMEMTRLVFEISNTTSKTVEINSFYSPESGRAYQPADLEISSFAKGHWQRAMGVSTHGGAYRYRLEAGHREFFTVLISNFTQSTVADSWRIGLDGIVSAPFKVPHAEPKQVRFSVVDVRPGSVLFKVQNRSDYPVQLPALLRDDGSEDFALSEVTIEQRRGGKWVSVKSIRKGESSGIEFTLHGKESLGFELDLDAFKGIKPGAVRLKLGRIVSETFNPGTFF